MTTFLKGDTTAEITLALAGGYDYSGKTVHLEYQGARRSFSGVAAGGVLAFSFTAAETAPMSLGAYPVRVWLEDGGGCVDTIHNAEVRLRVTDCAAEVHTDSAIYLDVRGGLYGIEGLPERFTDEDLRSKVNEILRRLGGTVAMAALAILPAFGGATVEVHTAPKGAIFNDQQVVTNVTVDVPDPDYTSGNTVLVDTIRANAPTVERLNVEAVEWTNRLQETASIRHGFHINGTDNEWQTDGFVMWRRTANGLAFPLYWFRTDGSVWLYDTNGSHRASIGFWGVFDGRRTFDWTDLLKVGDMPSWTMAETPPVPANYSSVSSAALSAVQTETDPTVPAWAKTETPPQTMTTNMVQAIVTNEVPVLSEWEFSGDTTYFHHLNMRHTPASDAGGGTHEKWSLYENQFLLAEMEAGEFATNLYFSAAGITATRTALGSTNALGLARIKDLDGLPTQQSVTNTIRDLSLGGIWDSELQVWWTPRMRNGSLTYEATTNVNLNAED